MAVLHWIAKTALTSITKHIRNMTPKTCAVSHQPMGQRQRPTPTIIICQPIRFIKIYQGHNITKCSKGHSIITTTSTKIITTAIVLSKWRTSQILLKATTRDINTTRDSLWGKTNGRTTITEVDMVTTLAATIITAIITAGLVNLRKASLAVQTHPIENVWFIRLRLNFVKRPCHLLSHKGANFVSTCRWPKCSLHFI